MFRFFFTIFLVLAAFLTGYYLGNEPVGHLTQSVNGLTIELDTMRDRMAAPAAAAAAAEGDGKAADELRVVNESITAMRQQLAEQKTLIEQTASNVSQGGGASAEVAKTRTELEACRADVLDLKARLGAAARPAAPAPSEPAAEPSLDPYKYKPYDPR